MSIECVNVRGDSTRHRYTLRRLVSQSLGVFCEFDVRGVQIGFAKVKGVIREITINRVHVDFIKVQRVFFVKLAFTKSGNPFAKLSSMDCELISPKFGRVFAKFTSHRVEEFWVTWIAPEAEKCTRISRKDLKLYFVIKKIPGVEFFHTGPLSLED